MDLTPTYQAGKYLQLALQLNGNDKEERLSYSIANSFHPEHPRRLQLFIQHRNQLAKAIVDRLYQMQSRQLPVTVTLPMGQAYLQTDVTLPHLLIAAGSGISKIKCITEAIVKQKSDANVSIYWSNKQIDDFYLLETFKRWAIEQPNLTFTPILETTHPEWSGRTGYIYQVIKHDLKHLAHTQAYLCGSPNMVYGTMDQLKAIGLKEEHCYSDVFEYAPRT